MKDKFKYTSTFTTEITASNIHSQSELNVSRASVNKLAKSVPFIDLDSNPDLFGISFEAALVNQFNENGDGVATEQALSMFRDFQEKPINVEHKREDIVGHIISASLCERGFGKELYYEDVMESDEVFAITLGGVVYKIVDSALTKELISMQESGNSDNKIHASWEIGFNKFYAAVGPTKLVKDCTIYTDDASIDKYKMYMRAFGGKGTDSEGNYVFRMPVGKIVPLGIGLTTNPAAKVDPIYVKTDSAEDSMAEEKDCASINEEKTEINISQTSQSNVRTDTETNKKGKIMDEKEIKEIVLAALAEQEDQQEAIASASDKIVEAIQSVNEKFVEEKAQIEAEKAEAEAEALAQKEKVEELSSKFEDVEKELSEAKEKIETFEQEKAEAEAQATFDARLDEIKSIYELNEEVTEIIAKRLSAIENDEQFDELKSEIEVTFAHFNKEKIAEEAQKLEEAKASAEEKVEENEEEVADPVSESKEEEPEVTNTAASASEQEPSFSERFQKAFNKETVSVS